MGRVASLATFDFHDLVLEDVGSLFVGVAFEARDILRGRGAQLVSPDSAMRIVAIGALNEAFIHAMVEGHFKLRPHLKMAGVTKLRLALHEQELLDGGMMGRMAIDATDLVAGMLRADGVHMFGVFCVAIEAALIHFFGCRFIEAEDFCGVGGVRGMGGTRPVAGFAAVTGNVVFLEEGYLPVRRFVPGVEDLLMTGLACVGAGVGGFGGRGRRRGRRLILLSAGRSGERQRDREEKRNQKNVGDPHSAPPHATDMQPAGKFRLNIFYAAIFISPLVTTSVTRVTKRRIAVTFASSRASYARPEWRKCSELHTLG
jgi:hypothetical protein